MSVSEARAGLPEVLDRVGRGEEITITRHGRPVAVVVRPDALRRRRAEVAIEGADRVRRMLSDGRRRPLASAPTVPSERAEALVDALRQDRRASR